MSMMDEIFDAARASQDAFAAGVRAADQGRPNRAGVMRSLGYMERARTKLLGTLAAQGFAETLHEAEQLLDDAIAEAQEALRQ